LQAEIERLYERNPPNYSEADFRLFAEFREALNQGRVRAAEPCPEARSGWRVNAWVKKGILLGFRMGGVIDMSIDPQRQPFFDKSTYPVRRLTAKSGVRIVPGGSSIRDGCYIGKGVTCMPPMYINVGAWVDDGTMVDCTPWWEAARRLGRTATFRPPARSAAYWNPLAPCP
jgi:2,3,4,5-tetrahydropyridine-2-carboxylate N-succinyltransferase